MDLEFLEQQITLQPYQLKHWLQYIQLLKQQNKIQETCLLYERSILFLPGSYKLWMSYLEYRISHCKTYFCITSGEYDKVNQLFERCLIYLYKMPLVWLRYLQFLLSQHLYTKFRKVFNRTLQHVGVTQHEIIWNAVLKDLLPQIKVTALGQHLYKRYLQIYPIHKNVLEKYFTYLMQQKQYFTLLEELYRFLTSPTIHLKQNQDETLYMYCWNRAIDLIQEHLSEMVSSPSHPLIEKVLREAIPLVNVELHGTLWNLLATYYIHLGLFNKVRDVYEEAMNQVNTVSNFSQIFDAYTKFEEELLLQYSEEEVEEMNMGIKRLEVLMERRTLLLSNVKLKQNPHNVHEWHKRIKYYATNGFMEKCVENYEEALKLVDAEQAVGKPHTLWCSFAKFYEKQKNLDSARNIFEKALEYPFPLTEDLAQVYCEYAEMELRHKYIEKAKLILERAIGLTSKAHKSVLVWSFYLDLEESVSKLERIIASYDRCIELRVATIPIILHYTSLLQKNKYFEYSFKVFERSVHLFPYPQVYTLWVHYLVSFLERYGGKKLERGRDLFERAVEKIPKDFAKGIFLLYAKYEEDYGLVRRAMNVYERAIKAVSSDEQFSIYSIYITRASEFYGVVKTRELYEKAIEELPDKAVSKLCILYSELEKQLGEVDRARAILAHGARFADPRADIDGYWKHFEKFEEQFGNVDSYKDLLRLKRSVTAAFSTSNINYQLSMIAQKQKEQKEQQQVQSGQNVVDHLQQLEEQRMKAAEEAQRKRAQEQLLSSNTEEIDLEEQTVPSEVISKNLKI